PAGTTFPPRSSFRENKSTCGPARIWTSYISRRLSSCGTLATSETLNIARRYSRPSRLRSRWSHSSRQARPAPFRSNSQDSVRPTYDRDRTVPADAATPLHHPLRTRGNSKPVGHRRRKSADSRLGGRDRDSATVPRNATDEDVELIRFVLRD